MVARCSGSGRFSLLLLVALAVYLRLVLVPNVFLSPPRTAGVPRRSNVFLSDARQQVESRAARESLGFFGDTLVSDEEWAEAVLLHRQTVSKTHRGSPWAVSNKWTPSFRTQCDRFGGLKRVGSSGDGGKWVCGLDLLRRKVQRLGGGENSVGESCLIYSIGSDNDFSFEEDVNKQTNGLCEIHTFDPSIGEEPSNWPRAVTAFHPWGLGRSTAGMYVRTPEQRAGSSTGGRGDGDHERGSSSPAGVLDGGGRLVSSKRAIMIPTVTEIKKKLGHEHRKIDVLKMDCEGCEWDRDVMESVFGERGGMAATQVLVEVHRGRGEEQVQSVGTIGDPRAARRAPKQHVSAKTAGAERWFREITEKHGYVMVSREPTSGVLLTREGEYQAIEFSFLRMGSLGAAETTASGDVVGGALATKWPLNHRVVRGSALSSP